MPRSCNADISHDDRVAAPGFGHEALLGELLHDARRIGVVAIDLVDRDDDRHPSGPRVVDRLDRLRHHTVVGRDDEHDDVGDLGAPGAHLREGLVARCVDERDEAAVLDGLVRADVLRDATRLAGDDVRGPDAVEQQRLAVVDVTHHGDDRRPRPLRVGVVVIVVVEQLLELELLLLSGLDEQEVRADLEREQLHLLVGERHGRGHHRALLQQVAHDVGGGAVQLRSELLRARAALDDDRALGHRRVGRRVRRRGLRLQLLHVPATAALCRPRLATLTRPAALPRTARSATGTRRATRPTTRSTEPGARSSASTTGPLGPPPARGGPPGRARVRAAAGARRHPGERAGAGPRPPMPGGGGIGLPLCERGGPGGGGIGLPLADRGGAVGAGALRSRSACSLPQRARSRQRRRAGRRGWSAHGGALAAGALGAGALAAGALTAGAGGAG